MTEVVRGDVREPVVGEDKVLETGQAVERPVGQAGDLVVAEISDKRHRHLTISCQYIA